MLNDRGEEWPVFNVEERSFFMVNALDHYSGNAQRKST